MSKPDHLFLKPVKGRLVRDPRTKAKLSVKGERKPRNSYWVRRLRSGDVEKLAARIMKEPIRDPNMTVELPTMTVEESKTNG